MKELSLNILDIAMNSVKAGANVVSITLTEENNTFKIAIEDNGCGMGKEQVEKLSDPFYTTRTTRKVGMGIPFFRLAAEQTGGNVTITSVPESDNNDKHGTSVTAVLNKNHIDFTPLGDIVSTLITLIHGYPNIDFYFLHNINGNQVKLTTKEIKDNLGAEIPINTPEVLVWIRDYLTDQYDNIN